MTDRVFIIVDSHNNAVMMQFYILKEDAERAKREAQDAFEGLQILELEAG